MAYSEKFTELLTKISTNGPLYPVVFDLTSVDGNAFSLMGHWQKAAKRQAKWPQEDIDTVLEECMAGDYNHLVATLLEVSMSEAPDEDEDDYGPNLYDDQDDQHIRTRYYH